MLGARDHSLYQLTCAIICLFSVTVTHCVAVVPGKPKPVTRHSPHSPHSSLSNTHANREDLDFVARCTARHWRPSGHSDVALARRAGHGQQALV